MANLCRFLLLLETLLMCATILLCID